MKALLIVDLQVGCLAEASPTLDVPGVISRVNALAADVRKQGIVIFVQHTDASDGLARGSSAWQVSPALSQDASDLFVEKEACDGFLETPLDELLKARGIQELIIVGSATEFCIDTTVRSAAGRGYDVSVAADCHLTRDKTHLPAAKIVEHHNFVWAELSLPRGRKIRLVNASALLSECGRRG
jgi:nicotinamidase-related amidase